MTNYIVVKQTKEQYQMQLGRPRAQDGRQVPFMAETPLYPFEGMTKAEQEINERYLQRQPYFIVKTLEEAEAVAEQMSQLSPGLSWLIGKLEMKVFTPPGKLTKAAYTEKGVLPV